MVCLTPTRDSLAAIHQPCTCQSVCGNNISRREPVLHSSVESPISKPLSTVRWSAPRAKPQQPPQSLEVENRYMTLSLKEKTLNQRDLTA